MIKENTLFILGAGASTPYGFPTGNKLRENISKKLGLLINKYINPESSFEDDALFDLLKDLPEFTSSLSRSLASIDLFLSWQNRFEEIGKIGIILSIIDFEIQSTFREESKNVSSDWYSHIFRFLTKDITKYDDYKSFENNKVNFVTFNYDRSLEYLISDSLAAAFNLNMAELQGLMSNIQFHHVYGKVAKLSWQNEDSKVLDYLRPKSAGNYKFSLNFIKSLMKNIYLIQERQDINKEIIKSLIKNASKIYVLGFGFLKENMEILDLVSNCNYNSHIYCTAIHNNEEENKQIILNNFIEKGKLTPPHTPLNHRVHIKNMNCLELLREFPLK